MTLKKIRRYWPVLVVLGGIVYPPSIVWAGNEAGLSSDGVLTTMVGALIGTALGAIGSRWGKRADKADESGERLARLEAKMEQIQADMARTTATLDQINREVSRMCGLRDTLRELGRPSKPPGDA